MRLPGSGWWGAGGPAWRSAWVIEGCGGHSWPCVLAKAWALSTQAPFYGAQQEKLLVPGRKKCFSPELLVGFLKKNISGDQERHSSICLL